MFPCRCEIIEIDGVLKSTNKKCFIHNIAYGGFEKLNKLEAYERGKLDGIDKSIDATKFFMEQVDNIAKIILRDLIEELEKLKKGENEKTSEKKEL